MSETFEFVKTVKLEDAHGRAIGEGSVLRNVNDSSVRGVAQTVVRRGTVHTIPAAAVGDIAIRLCAGHHRITNCYSDWEHVPASELSYNERFYSWLFVRDGYNPFIGEDRSEDESIAMWGIMSLLPEGVFNFEDDWPTSVEDCLEILARHLTDVKKSGGVA